MLSFVMVRNLGWNLGREGLRGQNGWRCLHISRFKAGPVLFLGFALVQTACSDWNITVEHEVIADPTNSLFTRDVVGLELVHVVLGTIDINPVM
jgi:hypothetical protein